MSESMVRLSDLCNIVSEPVAPRERPDAVYVGLEHLATGRFTRIGAGRASDVRSSKSTFKSGDILYGKLRPYLDKAALAQDEGICSTDLLVLRPKKEVNPRFLVGVVHAPAFVGYAVSGTSGVQHPRTSWAHIQEFLLPEQVVEEQDKVADLLWLAHHVITACETTIATANELKRVAMQQLFTRGLRGEAQKETEIGPMPESWNLTPCEQIFKLTSGKKRPNNLSDFPSEAKPFPVLGGNGVMGFSDEWYLDKNQVLIIGRVGEYCGAIHFASGKFWVTDNALYAKEWSNDRADLAFVGLFLEYFDLNRFKRMAGQPLVTQGMINEHRIPLPRTLDEQREVVTILDAINRKIDLHRRKRAVLDELFKALLHKLMTGEISVSELDLPLLPSVITDTTIGRDTTNE